MTDENPTSAINLQYSTDKEIFERRNNFLKEEENERSNISKNVEKIGLHQFKDYEQPKTINSHFKKQPDDDHFWFETSQMNRNPRESKKHPNSVEKSHHHYKKAEDGLNYPIETSTNRKSKVIPDGGWGWVIVLASLILCMIQDGISFSFGILYVEFFQEFGASSTATSWIGSLFVAVPLLTGPIMSALVDKYGCRITTITAGLVSAAGFLLSSFAQSIGMLYFTFGILSALGLGLTFVTSVVCITFWFEKKRNLAVGLGACGIGIGTFIYAPLTSFLIAEFGWRGTLMVLAGTLLNMCVCGGLMRDPEWMKHRDSFAESRNSSFAHSNHEELRKMIQSGEDVDHILESLVAAIRKSDVQNVGYNGNDHHESEKYYQSVMNLPTFMEDDRGEKTISAGNQKLSQITLDNNLSFLQYQSISDKDLSQGNNITTRSGKIDSPSAFPVPDRSPDDVSRPLLADQKKVRSPTVSSANQNYYFKNRRFSKHFMARNAAGSNKPSSLKAQSCPNISRVSENDRSAANDLGWHSTVVESLQEMFDFSLFLELHFFLMALSTLIVFAWFMTPYFYLADHMKLYDYSSTEASYMISVIGITNTIGMVILGWAGDQPWTDVTKTYGLCLIFCGISCSAIVYFTENYILLTAASALYGLTLASNFTFTPQILVELVSMERFTIGYGLILLCQGIGHLIGPPIAGYLYDVTKAWDSSFHLSGAWIIISGFLILVIPYTKNRKLKGCSFIVLETNNDNNKV